MTRTPDLLFHSGHRQRLTKKFLDNKATDYELLELLLTFGMARRDMRPLSRLLIKTFGSYHQVLSAPRDRLLEVHGVGPRLATLIQLAHQSAIIECRGRLDSQPVFHDERSLANYCKLNLAGKNVEEFHVLYLDKDNRLIMDDLHTIGTVDSATIYPREILRRGLYLNAVNVILVHNHPSECVSFSKDDIICTEHIVRKLAENDIGFYDHYLVSGTMVYSMINCNLLNKSDIVKQTRQQNPVHDYQI